MTASSDCGNVVLSYIEGDWSTDFCFYQRDLFIIATDEAHHSTTKILQYTLHDYTPPTFTVPADVIINCNEDPNDTNITGKPTNLWDRCNPHSFMSGYADFGNTVVNCEGIISRLWTISDPCGNAS